MATRPARAPITIPQCGAHTRASALVRKAQLSTGTENAHIAAHDEPTTSAAETDDPDASEESLTKRALMDVARVAFASKGYLATSLRGDILGPTGISTGSFYHHFEDKTDLFIQMFQDAHHRWRLDLFSIFQPDSGLAPTLADVGLAWYELLTRHSAVMALGVRESMNPDERIREALLEQRTIAEAGLFLIALDQGVSTDEAARGAKLIVMLARGTVLRYVETPPEDRDEELAALLSEDLWRFAHGGLLNLQPRTPDATIGAAASDAP